MPYGPWRVLRNRNYLLLWMVGVFGDFGTWMQIASLGIYVTEVSGAARWTGIAGTTIYLVTGLLLPFGGVAADRHNRRKLVIFASSCQGVIGLGMAVSFVAGWDAPLWLVLMACLQGAFSALTVPAMLSIVPEIVPAERLANASLLSQMSWNFGRALGPFAAVALVHFSSYGAVFAVNGLTFAAVAVALHRLRLPHRPPVESGSTLERLRTGWRALQTSVACRTVNRLIVLEMGVVGPFIALIPVMGQLTLRGGAGATGTLFLAQGLGSALVSLGIGSLVDRIDRGRMLAMLFLALPVLIVAYALSPNLAVAAVMVFLLGGVHTTAYAVSMAILQEKSPAHARARINGLSRSMSNVVYSATSTALAPLADAIGLRATLVVMATVMASGLCAYRFLVAGGPIHERVADEAPVSSVPDVP
jgi:MFS family permease